jgi:hypothetical protein
MWHRFGQRCLRDSGGGTCVMHLHDDSSSTMAVAAVTARMQSIPILNNLSGGMNVIGLMSPTAQLWQQQ